MKSTSTVSAVVAGLKNAGGANIGGNVGALATPHQTVEELYLLQKLMRGLGSNNIDFRLRQSDFSADGKLAGVPWLGLSIADIPQLDRVLVIGSTLRKDHPLIAHRLRQASKKSLKINILHSVDDDLLMRVANRSIVAPASLLAELAGIVKAAAAAKNVAAPAAVAAIPAPVQSLAAFGIERRATVTIEGDTTVIACTAGSQSAGVRFSDWTWASAGPELAFEYRASAPFTVDVTRSGATAPDVSDSLPVRRYGRRVSLGADSAQARLTEIGRAHV